LIQSQAGNGWIYYTHIEKGSPQPPKPLNISGIVISENLKTYDAPSYRANNIGKLSAGTKIIIQHEINRWYLIEVNNSKVWVYKGVSKQDITVEPKFVLVYEKASTRGNIVATLTTGNSVKILDVVNGWYKISFNNKIGWVYSSHLYNGSPALTKIQAVTIENNTAVYRYPDVMSKKLQTLSFGDHVYIIREVDNYYYLSSDQFGYGWVKKNKVVPFSGKLTSLYGKTIVIDPGHGGYDSGAIGRYFGTLEKNINLSTALLLKSKLNQLGVNVVVTRLTDTFITLENRVRISHNYNADAFISIHYNSFPNNTSVTGIETYYYTYKKDYLLGYYIQQEMIKKTNFKNRGVKFGNLYVLRNNKQPSVLLELGFLSNSIEEAIIRTDSYRDKVTDGIINGLKLYFSQK
jgi:N-acetylmuramoyl-L-alanine amidase